MNLLSLPDAQSHFRGILRLRRDEEGWTPERLTERQFAHYATHSEGRVIRSNCAAGVQLRFRTDSPTLDLAFECLGGARQYLGIDVEVDGQCVHSVRRERFEGLFEQRLLDFQEAPAILRDITVHLPCSMVVRLKRVELRDGSAVRQAPVQPGRLLCLGDSITQGMSAISPLSTVTTQLARLLNSELLNQGIGGHTFEAAALDALPGFRPDRITVAYGTNDWKTGRDGDAIAANVRAYLARLRELFPGVPIWIISPLWRDIGAQRLASGMTLPECGRRILATAGEFAGVGTVDGLALVPHQGLYFVDGTHPNELGFMHYAANLLRAIRQR
jgi:hypothetical protein